MDKKTSCSSVSIREIDDISIPDEIAESLCSCGGLEGLIANLPPDILLVKMRGWYKACADPARLKILFMLRIQPLCVCVIKGVVGMADSKLSYHLSILKKNGLIEGEQQGNYIVYRITPVARIFLNDEMKRSGFP
ncbi:MAG TPA: metalloregulator ArsR/SmtB family transcription factor [Methanoregulaceae archaeon]|nr:metalloregulator ArsR/SmtB family transcription factor [Methanoregulaceae archaeon]